MVKLLDESAEPELIEHVGWQLARAYHSWEQRFEERMARAGYPWVTEAKASVLQHLDRAGTPQAELAEKMQLSKQAVQQFVDQLVEAGIVERRSHPEDARSRLIFFTREGLAFLAQANRAKRDIEREYRRLIGARQFAELAKLLDALNASTAA